MTNDHKAVTSSERITWGVQPRSVPPVEYAHELIKLAHKYKVFGAIVWFQLEHAGFSAEQINQMLQEWHNYGEWMD